MSVKIVLATIMECVPTLMVPTTVTVMELVMKEQIVKQVLILFLFFPMFH